MPEMEFEQLQQGIYRLRIPFEEIYTSVFLLENQGRCLLLDGGPTAEAAMQYILPALEKAKAEPEMIVRSHCHGDHSGGVVRIAQAFPQAMIGLAEDDYPQNGRYLRLYDGDVLIDRFQVLSLPGHTAECIALLDIQTKTLLTGDCLQAGGIGKYGVSFTDVAAYLQSVERLRTMPVARIFASHDFAPYGFRSEGELAVNAFLDVCESNARQREIC